MPILDRKYADDFPGNWFGYTERYMTELAESPVLANLLPGQYRVTDGKIFLAKDLPPLHLNHRAIYETVLNLHPCSIMEVGCGAGDHLANLHQLLPSAEIYGCDLLETQLDVLGQRHPGLRDNVFVHDVVVAVPPQQAELVYTQAVLMHLGSGRLLAALWHTFAAATKYVIMMENWQCHDFYQNLQALATMRCFPWESLHCYISTITAQDLLVCSRESLTGSYKELHGDRQLRRRFRDG